MRHRLQPAAECAALSIDEALHLSRQFQEHILRNVLGIRLLQAPAPAPRVHLGPVTLYKQVPRALVGRGLLETAKQRQAGFRLGTVSHEIILTKAGKSNSKAIFEFF